MTICCCQSWNCPLCKCLGLRQWNYFQMLYKSQSARVLPSSMQKSEKWFSAKPHLTHGPQNTIYFDQCSQCSPRQLLQALTHKQTLGLTGELSHPLPALTQVTEAGNQSKGPGRQRPPRQHWVSPLVSNCSSWAPKSEAPRHVADDGGEHAGHREEGLLAPKAASKPGRASQVTGSQSNTP